MFQLDKIQESCAFEAGQFIWMNELPSFGMNGIHSIHSFILSFSHFTKSFIQSFIHSFLFLQLIHSCSTHSHWFNVFKRVVTYFHQYDAKNDSCIRIHNKFSFSCNWSLNFFTNDSRFIYFWTLLKTGLTILFYRKKISEGKKASIERVIWPQDPL